MESKKTKLELLLAALSDGDWHWGDELANRVSWRFGATVHIARKKGYLIDQEQIGRAHRYRLLKTSVVY
jgi:hypothetical protein